MAMSPVSTLTTGKTGKGAATVSRGNMEIPLRSSTAPIAAAPNPSKASTSGGDEYMVMSPVSVDPAEVKQRIAEEEEDEELRAVRERLERGPPGTPVHLRSGSDMSASGARSKRQSRSKRSSMCSDSGPDGGGRWSPTAPWDLQAMDAMSGQQPPENPEYAFMDYSRRHLLRQQQQVAGSMPSASAIPIPTGRLSPASSGSLGVSGTPNSVGMPPFSSAQEDASVPVETFESKAVSYLRPDNDNSPSPSGVGGGGAAPALTDSKLPLKAYPVTRGGPSSSSSSLSHHHQHRSRTSSLSVSSSIRSGRVPMTGQSPSIFSRLSDSLFRSRAGSVPSRPQLSGRRRHRTQSEGEKDSPENQEEAEATAEASKAAAAAAAEKQQANSGGSGSGGGGSGENPKG